LTAMAQAAPNIDDVSDVDAAHAINFSRPDALARIIDVFLRGEPLTELPEHEPTFADVTTFVDAGPG
jgi:hypothetical protein